MIKVPQWIANERFRYTKLARAHNPQPSDAPERRNDDAMKPNAGNKK